MKYRKLGRTGMDVSEIGHGTWGMGGMWGPRDDSSAIDSLKGGLKLGINFIDTASQYGDGHSECLVASALKGRRGHEVFIATKVAPKNGRWPASHTIPVEEVFPPEHVVQQTEQSLKNLRRDCVDLQQLHVWSDTWLKNPIFLQAIDQLKSQGKIRFFGISINDHEPNSALQAVASGLIDTVQVIYNIFDESPEDRLFTLCQEKGIGVIARVPFDEGSLADTFTAKMQFHKKDWRRHYFTPERLPEVCERVDKIKLLLKGEVKSLSEAAVKFCLSHPAVSTVIPGMRTLSHVEKNCAVSDGKLFSPPELLEFKKHRWARNFYRF